MSLFDDRLELAAMEGGKLSSQEVAELESAVAEDPDDEAQYAKLLGYYSHHRYQSDEARTAHERHALWIVTNKPERPLAVTSMVTILGAIPGEARDEAGRLWKQHVDASPDSVLVLAHAAEFLQFADRTLAREYLERCVALEPDNPDWHMHLGMVLRRAGGRDLSPEERRKDAGLALTAFEKASELTQLPEAQRYFLQLKGKAAFESGNYDKAQAYAKALLAVDADEDEWDYSSAKHHGNLILGRLALRQGDVDKAKEHLLVAGDIPGSPQLGSFGPNMALARELLEKGERDVVLEYFKLCEGFWDKHADILAKWSEAVENGEMPDFGPNLVY
jgi:tetratricopeptide (TPR) repeat protein